MLSDRRKKLVISLISSNATGFFTDLIFVHRVIIQDQKRILFNDSMIGPASSTMILLKSDSKLK